jgi:hypothetical protein
VVTSGKVMEIPTDMADHLKQVLRNVNVSYLRYNHEKAANTTLFGMSCHRHWREYSFIACDYRKT